MNASAISIFGNRLCGGIAELNLPRCLNNDSKKEKVIPISKEKVAPIYKILVVVTIVFFGLSLLVSIWCLYIKRKAITNAYLRLTVLLVSINDLLKEKLLKEKKERQAFGPMLKIALLRVSYERLYKATNGFSSSYLIGVGSFGSLYKGTLNDEGTIVAVKVLNLQRQGAFESFMAECNALKSIRHRNLLRVITSCSRADFQGNNFKAIIYQFITNESLENWLHPIEEELLEIQSLTLIQRINIAIDVAFGLDYLHHHCQEPIIHCDLKPSNVLLDRDMTGCVGDFGLARFVPEFSFYNESSSECNALKSIRHRNLLRVITSCSSADFQGNNFKAIIYEFITNGSLENWLHPIEEELLEIQSLTLIQRINIAIDVASGLDYLHHHCQEPIIHCDLKQSNVLLDRDMTGCVGDFGLARFVPEFSFYNESSSECNALKSIRHRNLLRVITSCSSADFQGNNFKAIIYEFITNGSLENWLHPIEEELLEIQSLTLIQRINIAIDVASGLDYLHHHCQEPIIHCDLKPSNVLLDRDMTGCVGDFGLARFVPEFSFYNKSSSFGVRGTIRYVAPEYGLGNKASTNGDVYSYGILLLEMVTGKKPTDPMLEGGLNLHNYARMALPDRVMEIFDPILIYKKVCGSNQRMMRQTGNKKKKECLISMVRIGVECSMESPQDRMNIRDVVRELQLVRDILLQPASVYNMQRGQRS